MAFQEAIKTARFKAKALSDLELALGHERVVRLKSTSLRADGSQYRAKSIPAPTRASILKTLQQEEDRTCRSLPLSRSANTGFRCIGINKGLELESRQ